MNTVIKFLTGIHTHLAMIVAVLTCLATFCGIFPSAQGHALAIGLLAVATSLQRFSNSSIEAQLEELLKQNSQPSPGPTLLKFPTASLAFLICSAASISFAQEGGYSPRLRIQQMDLQARTRSFFRNPDGSCVQCSIGMAGAHCNDANAASLLWDTPFGPAERGGSWPSRVEKYCDARGIRAWSVSGASVDDTWPWIEWAAKTGRFAALGAGEAHFQTLYGYDPAKNEWLICNNNSTDRIDRYSEAQMKSLHRVSGPWVVILEKPSSVAPVLTKWWK
jgi:hypothetical protein